ncbi:MAG TPA: hypothetical protein VF881_03130 [Polyangiaceae bacterium]
MRLASVITLLGSMLLGATVARCGGDDSSPGSAAGAGMAGSAAGATSTGAGGSTGGGETTGTGGSGSFDAGDCPVAKPENGSSCEVEQDCLYGADACTCVDPPTGHWLCSGTVMDGGNPSECPAEAPLGMNCPDAGMALDCRYPGDQLVCVCNPGDTEWGCVAYR